MSSLLGEQIEFFIQKSSSVVTLLSAFNTSSYFWVLLLATKPIYLNKRSQAFPHWLISKLSNRIDDSNLLFLKIKSILVSMTVNSILQSLWWKGFVVYLPFTILNPNLLAWQFLTQKLTKIIPWLKCKGLRIREKSAHVIPPGRDDISQHDAPVAANHQRPHPHPHHTHRAQHRNELICPHQRPVGTVPLPHNSKVEYKVLTEIQNLTD